MTRKPEAAGDRLPLLITIGLFVVMLASLPLVLRLDDGVDADRPMYLDVERMKNLQTSYVATGESPIEATLSGGESVSIGKSKFITSDGVTLTVRATEKDGFCISARDEEGATTERCSE